MSANQNSATTESIRAAVLLILAIGGGRTKHE